MTPALKRYFDFYSKRIDQAMLRFLPKVSQKPSVLYESMRYSINAGGKRLRPILVIAGAELCGGKAESVIPTACALEFIHTYSLIHDDLPAMDNDDLRRGKPTNHKVFGEDMAILAGDALLTLAFGLLAQNSYVKGIHSKAVIEVIRLIAEAAGTSGMVGGQAADIRADKGRWKNLKGSEFKTANQLLEFIHLKKTAALIQVSLVAGGRLVGGHSKKLNALATYGTCLGLTFQITDDILDQIGDKKKLGKRGSDSDNQKLTYPAIFGLKASQAKASQLTEKAHTSLKIFGNSAQILHELADFVFHRDH